MEAKTHRTARMPNSVDFSKCRLSSHHTNNNCFTLQTAHLMWLIRQGKNSTNDCPLTRGNFSRTRCITSRLIQFKSLTWCRHKPILTVHHCQTMSSWAHMLMCQAHPGNQLSSTIEPCVNRKLSSSHKGRPLLTSKRKLWNYACNSKSDSMSIPIGGKHKKGVDSSELAMSFSRPMSRESDKIVETKK